METVILFLTEQCIMSIMSMFSGDRYTQSKVVLVSFGKGKNQMVLWWIYIE